MKLSINCNFTCHAHSHIACNELTIFLFAYHHSSFVSLTSCSCIPREGFGGPRGAGPPTALVTSVPSNDGAAPLLLDVCLAPHKRRTEGYAITGHGPSHDRSVEGSTDEEVPIARDGLRFPSVSHWNNWLSPVILAATLFIASRVAGAHGWCNPSPAHLHLGGRAPNLGAAMANPLTPFLLVRPTSE